MADAALVTALSGAIAETHGLLARPVLVGISGVQGSGKSTLAAQLETALAAHALTVATLSLDDLYLTRAERATLGRAIHPLLVTRGVPGTHDLVLAEKIVTQLLAGSGPVAIPRFDKGRDDRAAEPHWPVVKAPVDVLLLEGWCIAATPEPKSALAVPVNALEAGEDQDLVWRNHANEALGTGYAQLFVRLDRLIVLRAPGFEAVRAWRHEQEAGLKARHGVDAGMATAALDRFIAHFERLSRHMLATPPPDGAIVIDLDASRRITSVLGLPPQRPGN